MNWNRSTVEAIARAIHDDGGGCCEMGYSFCRNPDAQEAALVADHHDQFLMAAVTRFRGMQRSEVEALLWMATDETEESYS